MVDREGSVRHRLAGNPKVIRRVLRVLAEDQDEVVAATATATARLGSGD